MIRTLSIAVPIPICFEHSSLEHRVCARCHRGCMVGRFQTATLCLNCASQRAGKRSAFRTAYHRIKSFADDDTGGAIV